MSEEKDWTTIAATASAFISAFGIAAIKYWKVISKFFKDEKEEEDLQTVKSLLTEVQELKKTVDTQALQIADQQKHIQKIESVLVEFGAILDILRILRTHRSLKFIESVTISLGFTDSVRPEYEDNLYDFLEQLEKGIRQIPLSGKKISLNFLGSRAFNSHANTAISQFFAKVNHQDVIRLKVLFPKIQSFEKLAKNLNSLRSTTNNENVQVVVFDDKKQ